VHYLKQVQHIPRRLIVLGIALLIFVVALQQTVIFSFAEFEQTVDNAGIFGPLIFTFVLFLGLTIPFNPVSDLATVNVAALLFEPEISIAGTVTAQSAALVVNYWFARHFGDRTLRLLSGERATAFVERFGGRMTYRTLFSLRFALPLTGIGVDVVTFLAALGRLGFIRFYFVSIIPWLIIDIIYYYSTSYLKGQSFILFFLPAVVLVTAPGAFLLWRNRRRNSAQRTAA
jgi:uncharacterized membrane protein YdjX (TVP38/TMEM64 family)